MCIMFINQQICPADIYRVTMGGRGGIFIMRISSVPLCVGPWSRLHTCIFVGESAMWCRVPKRGTVASI